MSQTVMTTRRDRPPGSQTALFVGLSLALVLAVIVFSTIFYGGIDGEEFSPDNFTRRRFHYYEIPLLGLQVSPIDRQDRTNDLERYLTTQNLVTEVKTSEAERRWDLVEAARGVAAGSLPFSQGDARILCSYLDTRNGSNNSVWLDWSRQHPQLAGVIWPLVAKLARQELYIFIPDLLVLARGASDPAGLQQQVDALLADKYLEFARTQQQLVQHAQAVELFTEAIVHAPQSAAAYSGRAQSLAALGKQAQASADMAQARGLDRR